MKKRIALLLLALLLLSACGQKPRETDILDYWREIYGEENVIQQDGAWVLVDYKSNYIDKEHLDAEMERLRADYLPQLALYREALEGVTGVPVKRAVLYLFGIDKEISIDEES